MSDFLIGLPEDNSLHCKTVGFRLRAHEWQTVEVGNVGAPQRLSLGGAINTSERLISPHGQSGERRFQSAAHSVKG